MVGAKSSMVACRIPPCWIPGPLIRKTPSGSWLPLRPSGLRPGVGQGMIPNWGEDIAR